MLADRHLFAEPSFFVCWMPTAGHEAAESSSL